MHDSVREFVTGIVSPRRDEISRKHIAEIGSRDINGSVKPIFVDCGPQSYLGIDISAGRFVDLVWDAEKLDLLPFNNLFDWVVCTETLEHVRNWKRVIDNLKSMVKFGGYLLITCRGKGFPNHAYPEDHWRFDLQDFRAIFSDFEDCLVIQDPEQSGVFFFGRKPLGDNIEVDLDNIELVNPELELDEATLRTQ